MRRPPPRSVEGRGDFATVESVAKRRVKHLRIEPEGWSTGFWITDREHDRYHRTARLQHPPAHRPELRPQRRINRTEERVVEHQIERLPGFECQSIADLNSAVIGIQRRPKRELDCLSKIEGGHAPSRPSERCCVVSSAGTRNKDPAGTRRPERRIERQPPLELRMSTSQIPGRRTGFIEPIPCVSPRVCLITRHAQSLRTNHPVRRGGVSLYWSRNPVLARGVDDADGIRTQLEIGGHDRDILNRGLSDKGRSQGVETQTANSKTMIVITPSATVTTMAGINHPPESPCCSCSRSICS